MSRMGRQRQILEAEKIGKYSTVRRHNDLITLGGLVKRVDPAWASSMMNLRRATMTTTIFFFIFSPNRLKYHWLKRIESSA